jgi:hypothetical protein
MPKYVIEREMPGRTMRTRKASSAAGILVWSLLLAAPSGGRAVNTQDDAPKNVTCSFSNPSYSGWCRETQPLQQGGSAEQACQDILSCLNNPQCNETFCNATQIRGGWKIEKVEVSGGGN